MPINALRAHSAEFGIVVAQGRVGVMMLAALVEDDEHDLIPGWREKRFRRSSTSCGMFTNGSASSSARS